MILHFIEPHRFAPRPFNRGGCAFRWGYYARPWALALDLCREARAVARRGLRGWDDSDTWSLDHHLARILPQMLRRIKGHAHGYPVRFAGGMDGESDPPPGVRDGDGASERWRSWLEDTARAFEEWSALMEQGPYARFHTDEDGAAFDRWLAAGTDGPMPSSLDRVPEADLQAARAEHDARFADVKRRLHDFIDHFEELWD